MRTATLVLASLMALGALPAHADNGDPIGSAVKVVDVVTAEIDRQSRTLGEKDDVVQNERISVSDNGLSEIVLADDTKLALGPGAKLTLDKFIYDPDKTGGAIVLNMSRGAFRFITGLAKKPSYVIRTPSASITVRGTVFDVFVEDSGAIWMLLHEGSVQVCNDRGQCQVLDDPCRAVRVDGGGEVGSPGNWNGLRGSDDVEFETAFPFIANPPSVDPEPRFQRAAIETGTCDDDDNTPPKTRRAEPREPSKKTKKAEPRDDPPSKKVRKAEPKYDPPKRKVVIVDTPKKKKYDQPKKKKNYDNANAAKALGLAIGIGLAIGASKGGGGRKGGYNKY